MGTESIYYYYIDKRNGNREMIKEYAIEKIEENTQEKPVYAGWAKERTGTDRYIAMWLMRSMDLRSRRDVAILNNIYKAYGISFKGFSEDKTARNTKAPNLEQLKLLGDNVESQGLDSLLSELPEDAFCSIGAV